MFSIYLYAKTFVITSLILLLSLGGFTACSTGGYVSVGSDAGEQLQNFCIDKEAEYQCRYAYALSILTKLTKAVREGYDKGNGAIPKEVALKYSNSLDKADEFMTTANKLAKSGDKAAAGKKVEAAISAVSALMFLLE